jgi:type II secretory pathway component PulJ
MRSNRAFTLMELLASVVLLVVLGTMLFQVFNESAKVVHWGNARVEIFQYARSLFEALHRELQGAIQATSADPSRGAPPFRVLHSGSVQATFGEQVRTGTDVMVFSSALIGRDTVEDSPTYGQTANAARVAYWVSPETHSLNRYESYDMSAQERGTGWEFALNVLDFDVECLDQWTDPPAFQAMDWNALDSVTNETRRGLPLALKVKIRLTDERHMLMYQYSSEAGSLVLRPEFTPEDDTMAQSFLQVVDVMLRQ